MHTAQHLTRLLLCSTLATSLLPLAAHGDQLYRWSDADGNVHYSDRLDPAHLEQGYRVISRQGTTLYTIESVTEQMAESSKAPEQQAEAKQRQAQLSRDRALLRTYANEAEINDARARKLSHLESLLGATEHAMRRLEERLHELSRKAGDYERTGKRAPEGLRQELAQTQDKLEHYQQTLAEQQDNRLSIQQQFDADLQRYREITAALPQPLTIRP